VSTVVVAQSQSGYLCRRDARRTPAGLGGMS
jgi:hypothetical protein